MLPQCLFRNVRRIFTHSLDYIFRQSRKFRYGVLYNIRYFRIVVIRAMDNFHTIFQLTVSTLQRIYPQTKSGQISCYSRYMECYTFQWCIPPRFIIGRINTQVIPQHQIIIFQIQDAILSIQITRYKYYFYLRFRNTSSYQVPGHDSYYATNV